MYNDNGQLRQFDYLAAKPREPCNTVPVTQLNVGHRPMSGANIEEGESREGGHSALPFWPSFWLLFPRTGKVTSPQPQLGQSRPQAAWFVIT
ncbi:hypothetical protein AGMMS49992_10360 [Clostridia bacterium]|nr:hypothetical protein AGMMS49992_10360 [Clostridia bacterium]